MLLTLNKCAWFEPRSFFSCLIGLPPALGHYDFPCYLVLIGITFLGQIVFGGCLCRSTAYDAWIFDQSSFLHPQGPNELNIGDCHFSTCAQFLTPVQAAGGRVLTAVENTWNEWLQMPRS